MLKCGITGASGILGKKIIKNLPFKFYCFKDDITKLTDVKKWVNNHNFDLIIHLAALVPTNEVNANYKKALNINVTGTKYLVNALLKKKIKPKWFFYSSTSHIYRVNKKLKLTNENEISNPQNLYGKTKRIAEKYLIKSFKNTKISLCIGRIFSFTDFKQKIPFVIPSIIKKIKSNKSKKIKIPNLNHYRDFLSTRIIVKYIYHLYKKKLEGIFNIGSGQAFHLEKIAIILCKKNKKTFMKTNDNTHPTYLVADVKKITKNCNINKLKFKNNLNYFY